MFQAEENISAFPTLVKFGRQSDEAVFSSLGISSFVKRNKKKVSSNTAKFINK